MILKHRTVILLLALAAASASVAAPAAFADQLDGEGVEVAARIQSGLSDGFAVGADADVADGFSDGVDGFSDGADGFSDGADRRVAEPAPPVPDPPLPITGG